MPDEPVPTDFFYRDEAPVLFGHYWLNGEPHIQNPRASCLDFSVAKGGYLTAYPLVRGARTQGQESGLGASLNSRTRLPPAATVN